ncbi:hypothetical protein PAMA_014022 [Pampus argenteus]
MDSSRSRPCPRSSSSPHHHSDSFLLCFTLLHGQVAEQLAYYVHVSETVIAEETFDVSAPTGTRASRTTTPPQSGVASPASQMSNEIIRLRFQSISVDRIFEGYVISSKLEGNIPAHLAD